MGSFGVLLVSKDSFVISIVNNFGKKVNCLE